MEIKNIEKLIERYAEMLKIANNEALVLATIVDEQAERIKELEAQNESQNTPTEAVNP